VNTELDMLNNSDELTELQLDLVVGGRDVGIFNCAALVFSIQKRYEMLEQHINCDSAQQNQLQANQSRQSLLL
jgi:hypothetical protein